MNTAALLQPHCVWDARAELGEGPVWSVREQALYFVDIVGQAIHRFHPESGQHASWSAPQRPGFVVPVSDGTLICGLKDGLYGFDPASGRFDCMVAVERELPGNRINDGCVDSKGRLWFGTMDDGEATPSGALYSVTRGKGRTLDVLRHDEGYVVTNGPAVSPDGTKLYHNHSPAGIIYVFDLAPDGALSNRRVFARVTDGYPDGVVVDSAGTLWVGAWNGGRVMRFAPDGTELPPIALPAVNVTKVAFGGPDLRTLYVTTARKNTPPDVLARYPQAGGLFSLRVDVPGQEPVAFPVDEMDALGDIALD
ncbi:SMP-30/gluconolactonase/LRE family protein [Komagataeibacter medellinensis]|uniref:Transcriptional regulator n=1 Tax=Komagataeibacter medellinensis (strain NBRC 3288 / BCRC 11682 / LMG 1693 / Kondo 51) TaxID=634177 RepID=G2I2J1_KOMMN|nr:SMP-30/gluconolactonase/LRE family protein [Komagataeibacter medellinensis]BAK84970.1 transcriptional regulator [Komagataeibacter medellinensis NBRC 3288]